jgi:hypothetical protein
MKFGNEFWLILSREYKSPNLFAVYALKVKLDLQATVPLSENISFYGAAT